VCLPKDTQGFLGYAAAIGVDMPLLSAVVAVNDRIAETVDREVDRMTDTGGMAPETVAGGVAAGLVADPVAGS